LATASQNGYYYTFILAHKFAKCLLIFNNFKTRHYLILAISYLTFHMLLHKFVKYIGAFSPVQFNSVQMK